MKLDILNKKFPTLVGIIIITIGIGITTFLIGGDTLFEISAGPTNIPDDVKVTNVTDDSFTISYSTDDSVIGTINYGKEPTTLGNLVLDDRDQLTQNVIKRNSHSISVKNLQPQTTYYYSITSGDEVFLDNESPYNAKTGSLISKSPSTQIPITGKVLMPDGSPANDGLVYVIIAGAQTLSSTIKKDGTYIIPLNTLRNSSFNDFFKLSQRTILNLDIISNKFISKIDASLNQINPVPTISLSGNYDFSENKNMMEKDSTNSGEIFPVFGVKQTVVEPEILNPKNKEELSNQLPTFEGTAQPNEIVIIEIHSEENISTQVTADEKGNWTYTPSTSLSPGEHTITITTIDSLGVINKVTKTFNVPEVQGQVIVNSPTPITNQIQIPTPILTIISTPIPTSLISDSTVTPTIQASISPTPTPKSTGGSFVLFAGFIGIAAAISGIFLFLYTRKQKSS